MAEATAAEKRTEEKHSWREAAAAADDGEGIEILGVNVNSESEMQEVYEALKITKIGPKSRLRAYMQRIQQQQRNKLTELPPQHAVAARHPTTQDDTAAIINAEKIWNSVLRIRSDVDGDTATALVFDVYEGYLYPVSANEFSLQDVFREHLLS